MNSNQMFNSFNDLKVMVIGDVMIDRYLEGSVTRISPEAPVPIVHLSSSDNRLGGAANVALNIQSLGATVFLFGVIGNDENTLLFEKILSQKNLWNKGILKSDSRCTTVKTRVIAQKQQMLRVDREDVKPLLENEEELFLEKINTFLIAEKIDVIILQDYNKGVFSKKIIQSVLAEAKKRKIKTIVDPKKDNFLAFKEVDIFKPNLKEVKESIPFSINANQEDLEKASRYLMKNSNIKNTIITLSEKGIFIDDGNSSNIIPTQIRKIADVCGAGDSVVSVAALGLALNLELSEIAILSNLAGGQVCEKVGVVTIDKVQLKKEFEQLLEGTFS